MKDMAAQLEAEEQGPVDNDALYEQVRHPEKCQVRFTKV